MNNEYFILILIFQSKYIETYNMLHQSFKIISFFYRKISKTIVNVSTDIKQCQESYFKNSILYLIWATNMSIDILYPVNVNVIGINQRKIDIYIKVTCKTIYCAYFREKIRFNNLNGKFNSAKKKLNLQLFDYRVLINKYHQVDIE